METGDKLYCTFCGTHSAFDIASRRYAYMTVEPVSPLSFAGVPLFLTAFNTSKEFPKTNNLITASEEAKEEGR